MQLLYIFLLFIIVVQIVIFLLLNIPTPQGVKGRVAKFLENNRRNQIFLILLGVITLLAVVLWIDCSRMEDKYRGERIIVDSQPGVVGTEIRRAELSYKMLLVQRNKYICFMAVFTSISLNIFISLLRYMYQKRDHFDLQKNIAQVRVSEGARESTTSANRNSTDSDREPLIAKKIN